MKETKFKNTEIGRIPDDWEVRTINSFCSVESTYKKCLREE